MSEEYIDPLERCHYPNRKNIKCPLCGAKLHFHADNGQFFHWCADCQFRQKECSDKKTAISTMRGIYNDLRAIIENRKKKGTPLNQFLTPNNMELL